MRRHLPALLMLGNAVLAILFTLATDDKLYSRLVSAIGNGVVLGLLALALALRPRGVVITLARGVAYAAIIAMTILLLISGAAFALFSGPTAWLALLAGIGVIALQIALLRALPWPAMTRVGRMARGVLGTFVAFFVYFQIFYVAEIAASMLPVLESAPRMRASRVMRESVPRVQSCAIAYARRHGAYPTSLAAMGPAPVGDGCLDAAHASGKVGDITLTYTPTADGQGVIDRYEVVAKGNVGFERGQLRTVIGDETGIVYAADSIENVPGVKVYHGGMLGVRALRACAELHRAENGAYPRDTREAFKFRETDSHHEPVRWLGCYGPSMYGVSFDTLSRQSDIGTYTPVGDTARPSDYVLEIRPRRYGIDGVRSVRVTARGRVHATVEDRPATESDSVVAECAYEFDAGTCAAAPGGIPARFDVVVPDTVAPGDTFTVHITDTRKTAERDHPYHYAVECNYRRFVDKGNPPATYSTSVAAQCIADPDRSDGAYTVLKVWARDYATSETSLYRRVFLRR